MSHSKLAHGEQTPFSKVVDIVGVVATFLPRKQLVLLLRLVCSRWGIAVADVLRVLKCVTMINNEQLGRIVAAFPELRTLELRRCDFLTIEGFRSLRSLAGLATLVLRDDARAQSHNVTDAVLEEISQIPSLTALNVAGCDKFTSAGLDSLQQLPLLETLVVSFCPQLDAAAFDVVARLPALKSLSMAGRNLTDAALENVCNAPRLTSLHFRLIDFGKLTVAGAQHFTQLTALQSLTPPEETNDDWLAIVGRLALLTALDLSHCRRVTENGIAHLSGLTRLTELHLTDCQSLRGCRVTDRLLAVVGQFVRLKTFYATLSDSVTKDGVKRLRALTALKDLRLGCSTDEVLAAIAELPALESLDVGGSTAVTDAGLVSVAQLTTLVKLDVSQCAKITDHGLESVAKLHGLRSLNASNCPLITDTGVAAIARLSRLETLVLNQMRFDKCERITDKSLEALRGLTRLRMLYLARCELITNDGLAHLGEMRTLLMLSLRGCALLTDTGLKHLRGLSSLQWLDVEDCKLLSAKAVASLRAANPELRECDFKEEDPAIFKVGHAVGKALLPIAAVFCHITGIKFW